MIAREMLLMSFICLVGSTTVYCQPRTDSTGRYALVISPRINSSGYFPFTGAVVNHHANFDFTVAYEKNNYGFFLFQSFDLVDRTSPLNYFQPAAFKKFSLTDRLKLGVYFGYLFSQTTGFSDKGQSDYFGALSQHWDITKRLRLENTMLIGDVSTQPKLTNRLLLIYRIKRMRFDFFFHERVVFETKDISTSAAVTTYLPKIKIADKMVAQLGITYQTYLTSNRPGYALSNGLFFSFAFPIDMSR